MNRSSEISEIGVYRDNREAGQQPAFHSREQFQWVTLTFPVPPMAVND